MCRCKVLLLINDNTNNNNYDNDDDYNDGEGGRPLEKGEEVEKDVEADDNGLRPYRPMSR